MKTASNESLSRIGLGTYLGHLNDLTDLDLTATIIKAINIGINHIDTAPNYRAQRSERAIGLALKSFYSKRDSLFLSSKVGFVPFEWNVPQDDRAYLKTRFIDTGIFDEKDLIEGIQCFSPKYLEWQVNDSIARMGLGYIDLLYLHNIELAFRALTKQQQESLFKASLKSLKKMYQAGLIRYIGVASWSGFLMEDGTGLQIQELMKWVKEVDCLDIFKVIQAPFNLGMPDLLFKKTQIVDQINMSLGRAVSQFELELVTSAPIMHGQLISLDLPELLVSAWPGLNTAQICLSMVKNAPGIMSSLVGVKSNAHFEQLQRVINATPITPNEYLKLLK